MIEDVLRIEDVHMTTNARWIGWVLRDRIPPWIETLDAVLNNPSAYGTRLHYTDVGGESGNPAGVAACGAAVPKDDPDQICFWFDDGVRCKRCARRLNADHR